MRWILGNGKTINFWTFNWVFDFPLATLVSNDKLHLINWNDTVDQFIINKNWNRAKLSTFFDPALVDQVIGVPISYSNQVDKHIQGPS